MMLAAVWLAAAVPPLAVPAPSSEVAADGSVLLPAMTPVRLATRDAVDSRSVRQGQRFALTVADPIRLGERIVIPAGTPAVGEVESASPKSSGGRGAKLALVPLFIEWRGERIFLRGRHEETGGSGVGASVATTVLLSPLGVLISGKSATVPAGSTINGEIRGDVRLVPAQ